MKPVNPTESFMSRIYGIVFIAVIVVGTIFIVNRFKIGGGAGALGTK